MQYNNVKNPFYLKKEARELLGKNVSEKQGALKYYMNKENDPESVGIIFGGINKKLGLEGKEVTNKQFNRMVFGYNPIDGSKMLKNSGDKKQKFGKEPIFTANKGVSLILEACDDDLRKEIIEKCDRANSVGMDTILSQLRYRDQSKGKVAYIEAQNFSYIRFTHGDSRNGDMNRHYHNIIQQYVEGINGKTYSLEDSNVYQDFDKSQVAFSSELAKGMMELGFELVFNGGYDWDIKGISKEAIKEYSSRTADIEKYLEKNPNASIEEAKTKTRKEKSNVPLADKQVVWKKELDEKYGINEKSVKSLITHKKEVYKPCTAKDVMEALADRKGAFFTSKDVDNALTYFSTFNKSINKVAIRKEIFSKDSIHSEKDTRKRGSKKQKQVMYVNKHFKGDEFKKEWNNSKDKLNKASFEISKAELKAIANKYSFDKKSKSFKKEGVEKGGLVDTLNKMREKEEGKKNNLPKKEESKNKDSEVSDNKPLDVSIKGSVAKVEDKKQFSNEAEKSSSSNKVSGVSMSGSGVLGIRVRAGELNNKLAQLLSQVASVGHDLVKYFELISQIFSVKLQLEQTLEDLAKEEKRDLEKHQKQFKQNDYSFDR